MGTEEIIDEIDPCFVYEKYLTLISEVENIYNELIFQQTYPFDPSRMKCMSNLMGTSISEGIYINYHLGKCKQIEGDICEFGVAQGATSALLAREIIETNKKIWLYDSFEGLPTPSKNDVLKDDIFQLGSISAYKGTMAYPKDLVEKRLLNVGFSLSRVNIIKGFFEDTMKNSENLPKKVCFAFVDFDFYEPIRDVLNFLNTVIQKDGVIIVDDYNFFSTGVKKAVDEFLNDHKSNYEFILPINAVRKFCILKRIV
jgi:hypothetical protein